MNVRGLIAAMAFCLFASFTGANAKAVPPPVKDGEIAIHEINVDQAAATLVETTCGVIMIDAGGRTEADTKHLMAYLQDFFAARPQLNNTLLAFYLSHAHIDHDLSLMEVARAYRIKTFLYNGHVVGSGWEPIREMQAFADKNSIPIRTINDATLPKLKQRNYTDADIDPLNCSGVDPLIRALSGAITTNPGWKKKDFIDDNNHSVVVRIDYGKASFLFMGDMETPAQRDLIARFGATDLLDVDVYHVAHHGSHNATDQLTMQALTPKIALMGVGDVHDHGAHTAFEYGHPRKSAMDALLNGVSGSRAPFTCQVATAPRTFMSVTIDKAIYGTGWDGDIVVTATADGSYAVWTSRGDG